MAIIRLSSIKPTNSSTEPAIETFLPLSLDAISTDLHLFGKDLNCG